jgi:AcrR family transcriptional regulator
MKSTQTGRKFVVPRITKPVEERRQEIIETAKKLFIENGFDKTQVADISRSMNAAQGLVYHYFKSKTDILYAVIDTLAAQHAEQMEQILNANVGNASEKLSLLFNNRPHADRYDKLIPSLMSDKAILEYCTNTMLTSAMSVLIPLIESGNADGSWHCKYPKETAVFIMHGFSGLLGFWETSKHEEPMIQAFTNIIFRILGTDAEDPPT